MFDLSAQGASLSCPTAQGLLHIEFCYILNFPAFPLVLKQKLLLCKKQSNCLRAVFCCCVLPENHELQRRQAQLCLSPTLVFWMEGSRNSVWMWHLGTRSEGERGSAGERGGLFQPNDSTSRLARTCWSLCWLNPSAFQSLGKFLSQTWTWTLLK